MTLGDDPYSGKLRLERNRVVDIDLVVAAFMQHMRLLISNGMTSSEVRHELIIEIYCPLP